MINVTFEMGTGFAPRIVRITTTSTLTQVTAAGWYKNLPPNQLVPSDQVEIAYAQGTTSAATAVFDVSITAGVVTLGLAESTVILPVVSGDFANFSGTSGAIRDAGFSPTNAAKTKVVMLDAAPTINHIAKFTAADGTVGDGGVLGTAAAKAASDNTKTTLASVNGATTINHVAQFSDTAGTIQDGGVLGTAAAKAASDNTKATVASVAAATTSGNILQSNDTAGTVADGPVAANKVLTSSIVTPDVSIDLVSFDVTVGQAALATGGAVTLITSSGSKQYKIRSLQLNSGGTNFSGGGGDRLGQVTDGTTVYSVVPAATMQALTNGQWGVTALPNPASAAINTSTVAGANLSFKYSGGTTDYTAGSLVITGIAQRVV